MIRLGMRLMSAAVPSREFGQEDFDRGIVRRKLGAQCPGFAIQAQFFELIETNKDSSDKDTGSWVGSMFATLFIVGIACWFTMSSSAQAAPADQADTPPLFDNLGTLHHPITTTSEKAQQHFDQGLRLVYAFNHEEAIRSFEAAIQQDPQAAMPYWGVALALGPNINSAMEKPMNVAPSRWSRRLGNWQRIQLVGRKPTSTRWSHDM